MERKETVSDLEQNKDNKADNSSSDQHETSESETLGSDLSTQSKTGEQTAETEVESVPDQPADSEAEQDSDDQDPHDSVSKEDSETSEDAPLTDDEQDTIGDNEEAMVFFRELVSKAKNLSQQTDWAYGASEFSNLALQAEQFNVEGSEEIRSILTEFESLREEFEQRRKDHYEELNKRKAQNLEKKKDLLKQFNAIIDEKRWSDTKEVGRIRNAWDQIKVLPAEAVDSLNEQFEKMMTEFESHKVDRLVKKLQKEEENLTLKLVILEKMDKLNQSLDKDADFNEKSDAFEDLLAQWRKIGRVPAEKNQETWDHFNKAQDTFNELRFKHDSSYRESVEKALSKKQKLIKEAEALVDMENIAKAARKVNKLHRAWKKTGNLPQKDENELWDRFKAATDTFNDKKSDNLDLLREQEQKNLDKKMALIAKAAEHKDADDFNAGHEMMQQLMEDWKNIGPAPRKKSSKIWKQFKKEMDDFYDRRREHFKHIRKDHKENLEKKKEILKKLEELKEHPDPALAVDEAKKLQQQFKDAGHVPIKHKNKIWKDYREICDVIYDNYRSSGSDRGKERKLASEGVEPKDRKKIIKSEKEIDNLKKDISRLESEIIQFKEAKTYFKPTNKGNKLIDELQQKIEKAEEKVNANKNKISALRGDIREVMQEATNDGDEEE